MLKIVVDENIADYSANFAHLGSITAVAGSEINSDQIRDADVLVVRSVTPINASLLTGTNIRFVGSATAGTDHVDLEYLAKRNVCFRNAPGSNAESVAEYVTAALLRLAAITDLRLCGRSLGVVGYGQTGSRVAARATALGMTVLANDPPLVDQTSLGPTNDGRIAAVELVDLSEILQCDVISLHVPLTHLNQHPTFHLIDAQALTAMTKGVWLINASRGAVVDGAALLKGLGSFSDAVDQAPANVSGLQSVRPAGHTGERKSRFQNEGRHPSRLVLDVWEGEPIPHSELIRSVDFGSPHVAGYSLDGKLAGTKMIADALQRWIDSGEAASSEPVDAARNYEHEIDLDQTTQIRPTKRSYKSVEDVLGDLVKQMFDISIDDHSMRALAELSEIERASAFRKLRKNYRTRRSFRTYSVSAADLPDEEFPGIAETVRAALKCRVW